MPSFTTYSGQTYTPNYGANPSVGSTTTSSTPSSAILAQQAKNVNSLTYTPIDTTALAQQATEQAAQNATQSLALEAQLSPGVSATRTGLQDTVANQLSQGGNLPPDVANLVSRETAGTSGSAGVLGSQTPLTAASLGLTSLGLMQQRQNNAGALLAANPVPTAGLDPGALASASIANTNAANNFALAKTGAQGNIANSQITANQYQNSVNAANASAPPTTLGAMPYVPLGSQSPQTDPWTGLPLGQQTAAQQLYAQNQTFAPAGGLNYNFNPNAQAGPGY